MQVRLSDHFTYKKLFRFVLPTVAMMMFTSLYTIVDGFFVSNFVGKIPFAALNLVMPLLMGINSFALMIGTGGGAIVSATFGEGREENARQYFTMLTKVIIIFGISSSILCFIFMEPIVKFLGASGDLIADSILYGRISALGITFLLLQVMFNTFYVIAERGNLNLILSVAAGIANIILDYLFIVVFKMEIAGAALATIMGQIIAGIFPLYYFSKKYTYLYFVKSKISWNILFRTVVNGSSELMTSLSSSIINILYNYQLLKFIGENGIVAYGVFMYTSFVFAAIIIGYSIGSSPIVSYNYGAQNHDELKNLYRKSLILIGIIGIILLILSRVFAEPLLKIFVGYDKELFEVSNNGFKIFSLFYLIFGFNIWGSAFFTALNNGMISALISFMRTLVFQSISVIFLPIILGLNGIWLSASIGEFLALCLTVFFFINKRKEYKY